MNTVISLIDMVVDSFQKIFLAALLSSSLLLSCDTPRSATQYENPSPQFHGPGDEGVSKVEIRNDTFSLELDTNLLQ